MRQLLLIIVFVFQYLSSAQHSVCDYTLKGKVLDKHTNMPVSFATIRVEGSQKYDLTDENGYFVISGLCSKSNTLEISCLGYTQATHEHHHEHGTETHFYLIQEVTGLEEVTIKAEKQKPKGTESLAQVTLIETDIASNPTQSLANLASKIQGVAFLSNGTNVQLPVIHGLSGNRILILNNGLKHGFQNWDSDHSPEIDLSAASHITVIKGASGVCFGPEALGGTILVESNPLLLNKSLNLNLGASYQTNGKGYQTHLKVAESTNKWGYSVNGNYVRIGDRFAPDYSLTNTGKEEKAISFGVLHHATDWDFKIYYSFIDQNLALLRSSVAESPDALFNAINTIEPSIINPFSYRINEPNQTIQHHLAKAEITWWYGKETHLKLVGGVQLNQRDEFDIRRNSDLPIIDLDLLTYDYQLEWKHPQWYGLDGLLGFQYFGQNNDNNPGTQTTPFIPNYNTNRYSGFMIERLDFDKNSVEMGVRIDIESNDVRGRETNQDIFRDNFSFSNFTASLGYIGQVSENSTFRTNLGTAWRSPNVAELYSFGQHDSQLTYGLLRFTENDGTLRTDEVIPFADSRIEAEKGYKFINEFITHNKRNSHSVTAYSHYIQNYIFERPIAILGTFRGPMPAFIFDQADALFLGIDYTWRKEWTNTVSGTFGCSYLWSRNVEKNEFLINQPPITTSLELKWNQGKFWKLDSSKWTLRPSYTFKQFQAPRTVTPESLINGSASINSESEIFDFIDAPDGYFLLDIAWNFGWKHITGSITAQNALNTRYRNYLNELRYFTDDLGINLLFTLNYSLKLRKNDTKKSL